jgi:hypothetical protein
MASEMSGPGYMAVVRTELATEFLGEHALCRTFPCRA